MRNRGCKYPENYQGRKEWMSLFSSEQEVPHEEFHSFKLFEIIAFSEYSICLIILGQDGSPGPSSGSWDGKSKFSVIHVTELIKFFSQKLNLLRSLYFLPITVRADFHFKVFLPQLPMGWLYGVPAANRSLMSWKRYMCVPQGSSMAWLSTDPAIRS